MTPKSNELFERAKELQNELHEIEAKNFRYSKLPRWKELTVEVDRLLWEVAFPYGPEYPGFPYQLD